MKNFEGLIQTTSCTARKFQNTKQGLSTPHTLPLKINHTLMKAHLLLQNPPKSRYVFAFGSHLPPPNFLSVWFLDYFCVTVPYKKVCAGSQAGKGWCKPAGERLSDNCAVPREARARCFAVIITLTFKL